MDHWRLEITQSIRRGQKLLAITRYREVAKVSLPEAIEFIDELEKALATNSYAEGDPLPLSQFDLELVTQIHAGNKIAAIKAYRKHYKTDLKASKEAVEQLMKAIGSPQSRNGCAGVLLECLIFIGPLTYLATM